MKRPSIGVAATFRDEVNALPGFIESAAKFFDHIFLVDCSMDMTPSTDGSLDIVRKWGLSDPPLWNLSAGFGAIRSQLIHSSPTDWTVVMDIDERMYVLVEEVRCHGDERFPSNPNPQLRVERTGGIYNQFHLLTKKIMEAEAYGRKAVRFQRRHWMDMSGNRPCENWNVHHDYQLRCMKSRAGVGFNPETKMHEHALDRTTGRNPEYIEDDPMLGPFLDHYHCFFKPMEKEQREADIRVYDALHFSEKHTPIPA